MLSCECREWDGEKGTWAFESPDNFSTLETKRRKRCSSCVELIDIGADCLKFWRVRAPYTDIEERIKGEEISMPPLYMCEKCGEIYLNLEAIGYCFAPTDGMKESLATYWKLTGFTPDGME